MTAATGKAESSEPASSASRRSFRQRHPRHPAEVTADRLGDAVERWNDRFDPEERDMVGRIIDRLDRIAEKGESGGAR